MTDSASPDPLAFLHQGGENGKLIAEFDWRATALGDIRHWPAVLKTATALILGSPTALVILWGADGVLLYNDAYTPFAGARHPALLGQPVAQAWPEVAAFNAGVLHEVLGAGKTLSYRNQGLALRRAGLPEDAWFDLDFSPIVDEVGQRVGVLAVVRETTVQVEAEQRLRTAQRFGGVGTFEWFPDTGKLEVSDEYRRIWGLDPGVEVTDELLLARIHPDDRPVPTFPRTDAVGRLTYAEYRRVDPATGEVHWIARRGEALAHGNHGRQSVLGVAIDITDRKRIEQTVQRSEARWRSLFEQMHEAFFIGEAVRDEHGRMIDFIFREVNPAFERQTGLPVAGVLNHRVREAIPTIEDALIERYARVVDSGESDQFEVYISALGNRWFEARARRVATERFSVLFVDISARRTAEQAVRESEQRFRTLAQAMPNHVWTSRANGHLDWFNDRVYHYSGAAPGTLDGAAWVAILHPDDRAAAAAAWTRACADGAEYEVEFRLRRHDGAYRWHIARAVPVRNAAGEIERWIGTNTDIEAQKSAEAELSTLAATLEQRVAERSAELLRTQDALRQAQKMESIGNLTGGIAHDFNNLLQVISGNLQMLADDVSGDAHATRRVRNAMQGVDRGSKLAAQLLAFGRRQPLAPKIVNIGHLVHNMDDLLRHALGEGIEVRTNVATDLWNTLVDVGNVENALLNLAINARDAMHSEGRLSIDATNTTLEALYVTSHGEVAPGDYVVLAVTDIGCGMSAQTIDKVCEPFFTTKPEGRGSGLGLSMVYGFVRQTGGHMDICSTVDEGTTIRIYLPRADAAETVLVDEQVSLAGGGNETILVAEDDDVVRETVVATLEGMGYHVLNARHATAALAILESGVAIDLLFTDVMMPGGMKGAELAQHARQFHPDLAVLFTSGYAEDSIMHDGRLDEGVELLSKPYTRQALAHKLRHVLAQHATIHAAPPPPAMVDATPSIAVAPKHILVCEDDWQVRNLLVETLQAQGHHVLACAEASQAMALHANHPIDLLLADVNLSGVSGIELARQLRALAPALPVVFATADAPSVGPIDDTHTVIVSKPYGIDELLAAVAKLCASSAHATQTST